MPSPVWRQRSTGLLKLIALPMPNPTGRRYNQKKFRRLLIMTKNVSPNQRGRLVATTTHSDAHQAALLIMQAVLAKDARTGDELSHYGIETYRVLMKQLTTSAT
jgi:hypothetical protein